MVQKFARRGAKVYLAARNKDRALEAISRLQAEGLAPGNGEVRWLQLDLALPPDVQKSAETFLKGEKRLDILGELHMSCTCTSCPLHFGDEPAVVNSAGRYAISPPCVTNLLNSSLAQSC